MDFINWYTSSPVIYVLALLSCAVGTGIAGAWLYQGIKDFKEWE